MVPNVVHCTQKLLFDIGLTFMKNAFSYFVNVILYKTNPSSFFFASMHNSRKMNKRVYNVKEILFYEACYSIFKYAASWNDFSANNAKIFLKKGII